MKVMIAGIDGYLGWPLALHLRERGHEVIGLDNLIRRYRVQHEGSESLLPICGIAKKQQEFPIDLTGLKYLTKLDGDLDAIVHLAEQPSAPWSMKSAEHASKTQFHNVLGTLNLLWLMQEFCPNAHLLKLGTMGEYGTPDCDIPEGSIPDGPMKGLPFPRSAGSFYHLSKVHDTHNIIFSCKTWGLRSTDIMQGVVFGHVPGTRFDYDECFGTVINRFCVQAVAGMPLTVYGQGGQTRGYLPIKDSIECLTLAVENPPKEGEYRTFNQFANLYSVNDLADLVLAAGNPLGLNVKISHIENPRVEKESHYYNPVHDKLRELGYEPKWHIMDEISQLLKAIIPYKKDIREEVIMPVTKWRKAV